MPAASRGTFRAVQRAARAPGRVLPAGATRIAAAQSAAVGCAELGFSEAECGQEWALEALSNARRRAQETPPAFERQRPGTLALDSDGELLELRRFRLSDPRFVATEPCRRNDTESKYEQWLRAGHPQPPGRAIENETGEVRLRDGHHRLCAAKGAGRRTFDAWVALTWKADRGGYTMPVGVTLDTARCLVSARRESECFK
jgi:hypothetical protein